MNGNFLPLENWPKIAHLVERLTLDLKVPGSSTNKIIFFSSKDVYFLHIRRLPMKIIKSCYFSAVDSVNFK